MRFSVFITLCLTAFFLFTPQSKASTYGIDISVGGSEPCPPLHFCFGGYQSPVFSVNGGDLVDFGTLTLHSQVYCDLRSGGTCTNFMGAYTIGYNSPAPFPNAFLPWLNHCEVGGPVITPTCPGPDWPVITQTIRLLLSIPDGVSTVQFAWFFADYSPPQAASPVPLPGTALLFASLLIILFFKTQQPVLLARRRSTRQLSQGS